MHNKEIFICNCNDIEHQLVISGDDEEIYFLIHIENYISFWQKLKNFIPFVFKLKKRTDDSQYIMFSEITENDIKKHLKKIIEK